MKNTSSVRRPPRLVAIAAAMTFGAGLFLTAPSPAKALTVYCTNCSTVFQQAMQYAKEVETAINTWEQLQTQIRQYQDMLLQGMRLPSSIFNSITGDMLRIQQLYQQSRALAGQIANFDEQFRRQFQDYDAYLTSVGQNPLATQAAYQRWTEQGFDAMRTAMHSAGLNVSSIADEDAVLAQLVARSQNAEGRLQAIQAGNEIAAQQVQQLQKLRQLLNDMVQSQSTWYAQNIERQALDDAFRQKFRSGQVRNSESRAF